MEAMTKTHCLKPVFIFIGIHVCSFFCLFIFSYLYNQEILLLDLRFIFLIFQFPGYYIWNSVGQQLFAGLVPSTFAVFVINGAFFAILGFLIGRRIDKSKARPEKKNITG